MMHKQKIINSKKEKKKKIILELELKKERLINSVKFQYERLIKNQTDKITEEYDRKLERRIRKIERIYKQKQSDKIKKEIYNKVVKNKENNNKIKQLAFIEVQKYAKLSRANEEGLVVQIDTGKILLWNKCQGGHIYPKKNYPQLAFNELNIRPISKYCNKKQADNIADRIEKTGMSKKEINYLKKQAEDKELKNKVLDGDYYRYQYEKYSKLNKNILEKFITKR